MFSRATRIPREEIVAVSSKGRTGRRGLLGGLVGLGAGVGLAVVAANSATSGEQGIGAGAAALVAPETGRNGR